MAPWSCARSKFGAGVVLLLIGWLAPQYITKLWATSFGLFLREQPASAALTAQCLWSILLAMPSKPPVRQSIELLDRHACWSSVVFVFFLSVIVLAVHITWFSSFSRLSVPTNTILWNTDTITTPLLSMLLWRRGMKLIGLGGCALGLVGTFVAAGADQKGDTPLGCGLCLFASLAYALNAVIVERFLETYRITVLRLLGFEGLFALAALLTGCLCAIIYAPLELQVWFSRLPSFGWLLLFGTLTICLNIGWLWCTETAGAFYAAMVGCFSIPCSMVCDLLLFDERPTLLGCIGSVFIFLGFLAVTKTSTEQANRQDVLRHENLVM